MSLHWPGRAFAVAILLLLAGCAADRGDIYTPLPGAAQRPHPEAVPHLDRGGAVRTRFDARQSLLPLALGGALVDYRRGVSRGFADAFAADFNAVVGDPEQPLPALLRAAGGSGVLLLRPGREAPASGGDMLVDAAAAAVIAVPRDPAQIDDFAIAARQAIAAGKPVWAMLPAYGKADLPLPEPGRARALAYAALVHGASGLIWQGEDNYAARNAGAIGIAAAPQLDYGIGTLGETPHVSVMAPPYRARPDEVAAAKRLWDAIAQLNRSIARLTPAWLHPDGDLRYSLAIAEPATTIATTAATPVRSLLRPWDDGWLLVVVNLEARVQAIRVDLAQPMRRIARFTGPDAALPLQQDAARGRFYDDLEPFGVRLYRLSP